MKDYFTEIAEEYGNDKSQADRFNQSKSKWSLPDYNALEGMVKILEFGAKKYSSHNWKKGLKTTEIVESLLRHAFAYLNGEDIDPESGLPHADHMQCNSIQCFSRT